jgi:hypothetical protein
MSLVSICTRHSRIWIEKSIAPVALGSKSTKTSLRRSSPRSCTSPMYTQYGNDMYVSFSQVGATWKHFKYWMEWKNGNKCMLIIFFFPLPSREKRDKKKREHNNIILQKLSIYLIRLWNVANKWFCGILHVFKKLRSIVYIPNRSILHEFLDRTIVHDPNRSI